MAQIRVDGLGPGGHQEDRAQDHEPVRLVGYEKMQTVPGQDRGQHRWIRGHLAQTEEGQSGHPDQNDRPEQGAHPGRAVAL